MSAHCVYTMQNVTDNRWPGMPLICHKLLNFLHYLANTISNGLVILRLFKITKYYTLLGFSQQNVRLEILLNILEDDILYFFISHIVFEQLLTPGRCSSGRKRARERRQGLPLVELEA